MTTFTSFDIGLYNGYSGNYSVETITIPHALDTPSKDIMKYYGDNRQIRCNMDNTWRIGIRAGIVDVNQKKYRAELTIGRYSFVFFLTIARGTGNVTVELLKPNPLGDQVLPTSGQNPSAIISMLAGRVVFAVTFTPATTTTFMGTSTTFGVTYGISARITYDAAGNNLSAHTQVTIAECIDTRISILSVLESIYGRNLSPVLFRSIRGTHLRRPSVVRVLIGEECTLIEKLVSPLLKDVDVNGLLTYCLLRYYLWYLISGKWSISIVKNKYSGLFYQALTQSPYAVWIYSFYQLREYRRYFV